MKKYIIKNADGSKHIYMNAMYKTRKEAVEELMEYINSHNWNLDVDDIEYLTPFDFVLEEVELTEVNEIISDFETARECLGVKPNVDFTVAQKKVSCNAALRLEDVTRLVQSLNPSHIEALIALNELFTIAQAWNKEDGFVPDFSNKNQMKYFPWFAYSDAACFICVSTNYMAIYADAYFGSRLCFKSEYRAEQFGKQFAHLYNKVFLNK